MWTPAGAIECVMPLYWSVAVCQALCTRCRRCKIGPSSLIRDGCEIDTSAGWARAFPARLAHYSIRFCTGTMQAHTAFTNGQRRSPQVRGHTKGTHPRTKSVPRHQPCVVVRASAAAEGAPTVVITGASSGIGKATAIKLAQQVRGRAAQAHISLTTAAHHCSLPSIHSRHNCTPLKRLLALFRLPQGCYNPQRDGAVLSLHHPCPRLRACLCASPQGWRVFAGVRKVPDGAALVQIHKSTTPVQPGGSLTPVILDVLDPQSIKEAAGKVGVHAHTRMCSTNGATQCVSSYSARMTHMKAEIGSCLHGGRGHMCVRSCRKPY